MLSSYSAALLLLLAFICTGSLAQQHQNGSELPSAATDHQNAAPGEPKQHHHHIFSSSSKNHTRRNHRHPRVPPRRDACDPHSVAPNKRCAYVTEQRSCEAAGGRVPYTRLWFCLVFGDDEDGEEGGVEGVRGVGNSTSSSSTTPLPPAARAFSLPAASLLLFAALLWAACLLSLLAVVSSQFLAPAVSWVATALRVPPALAGATLLALAGGAPDLATEIAAVLSRDYGGFGNGDFEMVYEDGTPAPPLTPAERGALIKDANAIVADDLGMGVAVALGSSLATLCCGLAAIGWFARSNSEDAVVDVSASGGRNRRSRSRSMRRSRSRNDDDKGEEVENDSSSPSSSSSYQPSPSSGIAVEDRRAFARDVAAYSIAVLALGAALFDGALGLWESVALLLVYLLYVAASVWGSRVSEAEKRERERKEELSRKEEERAEAAEEGEGAEEVKREVSVSGSPSPSRSPFSIEMTALASPPPPSSSSVLLQQLPPRSPVRSPVRNQQQQGGGRGAFAVAAAFPFPPRAVAAPRRRASTEVGDFYCNPNSSSNPNSNPNSTPSGHRVVAPPPTPIGGFGGLLLRNLLGGGGSGGNDFDSRTPLLPQLPSSPPEAEAAAEATASALSSSARAPFASAFSEPLTDVEGIPFPAAQSQQERRRSRSPQGRLLTRLPRRLSSAGGEGGAGAAAAEAGAAEAGAAEAREGAPATTGFSSLSPNAPAPLSLEMTATASTTTEMAADAAAAEAARQPRERKGLRGRRNDNDGNGGGSKRRRSALVVVVARAVLSGADDLLPSLLSRRLHPSARLLLAALVAPVAAVLHCTMPAFGEEEGDGSGSGESRSGNGSGVAVAVAETTTATTTTTKEAAAAVSPSPPPLPLPPPAAAPPEIPLLTLTKATVLCVCAPLAAASLLGATPTSSSGGGSSSWLRFSLSALGGSAALALAFTPYFWRSAGKPVPLRCAASAALALALSGAWLAAAADEAVDLARALARAARLPSEMAGGLLLGAGEALPDVAATAALARAAARASGVAAAGAAAAVAAAAASSTSSRSAVAARARAAAAAAKAAEAPARIALGATFGAPVFNLLVGLPLPAAIAALRSGWSSGGDSSLNPHANLNSNPISMKSHRVPLPVRLTNGALALGSASVVALALLSLSLPSRWCRWRVGRAVAAGAAAFWLAALAVFAMVEVGVVGGGGEAVPSAREVVIKP